GQCFGRFLLQAGAFCEMRADTFYGIHDRPTKIPADCSKIRCAFPRASRVQHVAQPLDPRGIECVQQYRVEAARRSLPQTGEIETCSGGHPCALCCSNARGGAAEVVAPPQPYFDEHQHITITGDEIELTDAAAPVALD